MSRKDYSVAYEDEEAEVVVDTLKEANVLIKQAKNDNRHGTVCRWNEIDGDMILDESFSKSF